MDKKKLPEVIKKVGFDFVWDNRKVWELDLPVEDISIGELTWHLEIPFWSSQSGYYDLSPNEVLKNPKKFKEEFDRTMEVDMLHPIDIMRWKGRWLILDGLHRLVKAKKIGMRKVNVRRVPKEKIFEIKKDE